MHIFSLFPLLNKKTTASYTSVTKDINAVKSHSLRMLSSVVLVVLLLLLLLFIGTAWYNQQRLAPTASHVMDINHLQTLALDLQHLLRQQVLDHTQPSRAQLNDLQNELELLSLLDQYLLPTTSTHIQNARKFLNTDEDMPSKKDLIKALDELLQGLLAEIKQHNQAIQNLNSEGSFIWQLSSSIIFVLLLLAAGLVLLLRTRIFQPLHNLQQLMTLLARQDYALASIRDADPILQPLLKRYNTMVTRLQELEQQHHSREQSLQREVQAATRALLQQHRSLARSEQLAAVGEMAASLSHELRNPLAGIQMALNNLLQDTADPEHQERLDLILGEVHRLNRLLNDTLNQTRHSPESYRLLRLAETVDSLLTLARYQLPDNIEVSQDIAPTLMCHLPESRLRQTLLNLILNAAQAIGEAKGHIYISAEVKEPYIEFTIRDDGSGFPQELLTGGVQAFATWRRGGTGLGLAAVRRFVRELDGQLSLQNVEPHGACVTLLLPCQKAYA